MKRMILPLIIVFFLTACASTSSHSRVSSTDMVEDAAVNIGADVAQHLNPDPVSLVWGGLGLTFKLIGMSTALFDRDKNHDNMMKKRDNIIPPP